MARLYSGDSAPKGGVFGLSVGTEGCNEGSLDPEGIEDIEGKEGREGEEGKERLANTSSRLGNTFSRLACSGLFLGGSGRMLGASLGWGR